MFLYKKKKQTDELTASRPTPSKCKHSKITEISLARARPDEEGREERGKLCFPLISRPVPTGRRAKKIWRMMLEEPKELIGKQIIVEGGSSWLALFLIVDQEED